jgi:fructose-1,6-bisphosphatase/inositol monophosphatase family enzyme
MLIVEEAGGVVSTVDGKPITLDPPFSIVASTPALHPQMMEIIKKTRENG